MFITDNDLKSRLNHTRDLFDQISTSVQIPDSVQVQDSVESGPEDKDCIQDEILEPELVEEDQENIKSGSSLVIAPLPPRGRSKGAKEIPDFLRPIIGASARISGSTEAAKAFNVSVATANNYSKGIIPSGDTTSVRPALKSKVEQLVGQAQETAAEKLMSALGFITDDKLKDVKAGDLSRIAADMSRVIEKTSEKKNFVGAQIVIYAPQLREEGKFDIVEQD